MSGPFLVTPAAQRPLRRDGRCFYCFQAIGTPHTEFCVLVSKRVRLRFTVEYEVGVPVHWGLEHVERRYSGALSYCVDNALNEIAAWTAGPDGPGCLCGAARVEALAVTSEPYLDEGPGDATCGGVSDG